MCTNSVLKTESYCFIFLGGSLADLIEKNNNSNEVMAEGELKPLLVQVLEVIIYDAMLCMT